MSELNIRALSEADRKRLLTQDGREVRIYATDHYNGVISGAVKDPVGWRGMSWCVSGRVFCEWGNSADLMLPPKKIERVLYASIYPQSSFGGTYFCDTESDAVKMRGANALATISIDLSAVPEGDGINGNVRTYKLVPVEGGK